MFWKGSEQLDIKRVGGGGGGGVHWNLNRRRIRQTAWLKVALFKHSYVW